MAEENPNPLDQESNHKNASQRRLLIISGLMLGLLGLVSIIALFWNDGGLFADAYRSFWVKVSPSKIDRGGELHVTWRSNKDTRQRYPYERLLVCPVQDLDDCATVKDTTNDGQTDITVDMPSGAYRVRLQALDRQKNPVNKITLLSNKFKVRKGEPPQESVSPPPSVSYSPPAPSIIPTPVKSPSSSVSPSASPKISPKITASPSVAPSARDKYKQPFAASSIWNMPIGKNAKYVPGNIPAHNVTGADEDILVLTPNAPQREVWVNNVGWTQGNRCTEQKYDNFKVPVPDNFVIGDERPSTPNYAGAFLLPDGRTIAQFSPVARCTPGGRVTYTDDARDDNVDIYGDGTYGAHGGSGLSSIGGTIRLGELTKNSPPIRHALKVVLEDRLAISSISGTFRWPAKWSDSCSPGCYKGKNPVLKMGALLALKPDFNLNALETEPAKKIAWTLINYGAYLVDNSGWSSYYFTTEKGPDGDVFTEFARNWGFTMTGISLSQWNGSIDQDPIPNIETPWGRDMNKIFGALNVVDNNSQTSVGGGGEPLQPLAPPLQ